MYTGTGMTGVAQKPLGTREDFVTIGRSYENNATWIDHEPILGIAALPLYAISGELTVVGNPSLLGDFDGNGERGVSDIDLLTLAVGGEDSTYDLNNDGAVDFVDRVIWVTDLTNTYLGDSNFDGLFDSSDFVAVFGENKYETGRDATWSEGDWNGDGKFDSADFIAAFGGNGYESGPREGGLMIVPESSPTMLIILLAFGLLVRFRDLMWEMRTCTNSRSNA